MRGIVPDGQLDYRLNKPFLNEFRLAVHCLGAAQRFPRAMPEAGAELSAGRVESR